MIFSAMLAKIYAAAFFGVSSPFVCIDYSLCL